MDEEEWDRKERELKSKNNTINKPGHVKVEIPEVTSLRKRKRKHDDVTVATTKIVPNSVFG